MRYYTKNGITLDLQNANARNILFRSNKLKQTEADQNIPKHRYAIIRTIALQTLLNVNTDSLPIEPNKIAELYNIMLLSYQSDISAVEIIDVDNNRLTHEAFSCTLNNQKIVCYNSNYPAVRTRFTVMHEISHMLLEHSNIMNYEQIEEEAQMLAARILMPLCIIHACHIKSVEELSKLFYVSKQSALIRLNKYQQVLNQSNIELCPEELKIVEKFNIFCKNYLDSKHFYKEEAQWENKKLQTIQFNPQ